MRVQGEVELQHIDMRLADDAKKPALDMARRPAACTVSPDRPRALATRGTWK